MPSYEQRGKNSYRLTVETEAGINQERGRERKTIKLPEGLTPKKQKEWLDSEWYKFKSEVESGTYIAPEKMTFETFVGEWQEKYEKKNYAPKTKELHASFLKHILPYFGHRKIRDIKTMHIVTFMSDIEDPGKRTFGKKKEFKGSTLSGIFRLLKAIFARAVTWKVIAESPMIGLKSPKVKKTKAAFYDEKESAELLRSLYTEPITWRALIMLAITTGLREGELAALESKYIDYENRTITVEFQKIYTKETGHTLTEPKSESGIRTISVPEFMIDLLKEVRKDKLLRSNESGDKWKGGKEHFIFTTSTGSAYSSGYIRGKWGRFVKAHGLRYIKFHSLRHTSATLLIGQGVHTKVISERLGHSDARVTLEVYGHVTRKVDQQAADKFVEMFGSIVQ